MENRDAEQRERDREVLRQALERIYKGPAPEDPHNDPVVFLRQLPRRVRKWLQGLSDEDVDTLEALGRQHQTAISVWRASRKLVAYVGATIIGTLAFGDQALSFLKKLRELVW